MRRMKMTIPFLTLRMTLAVLLVASIGFATLAQADSHEGNPALVKYRQTVMSNIGSNMGAIGAILKNGLKLPGHLAIHATQMAESADLIGPAFKENISTTETDALPAIWTDWAKFESAISDYKMAAENFATAASGNDPSKIGPAVKALGKSCGGCHKTFRKPKEESFKRKSSE